MRTSLSSARLPLAICVGAMAVAAALLAWIHLKTQRSPADMKAALTLVGPFWAAAAVAAGSLLWLLISLVAASFGWRD